MKKGILLISGMLFIGQAFAQLSSISGKVFEEETEEPVLFASVKLLQNGVFVSGVSTDFDGLYKLDNLEAGVYDLQVSYVGMTELKIEGIVLTVGESRQLDLEMLQPEGIICCCWFGHFYSVPLIDQADLTVGMTFKINSRGMIDE